MNIHVSPGFFGILTFLKWMSMRQVLLLQLFDYSELSEIKKHGNGSNVMSVTFRKNNQNSQASVILIVNCGPPNSCQHNLGRAATIPLVTLISFFFLFSLNYQVISSALKPRLIKFEAYVSHGLLWHYMLTTQTMLELCFLENVNKLVIY